MKESVYNAEDTQGKVVVNGVEVPTFKREFTSANIIEVEVGTTGYKGGDTGHGGHTYLSIKDCASTDMSVSVDDYGSENKVVLQFGGDCEMETLIDGLEFAAKTLREMSGYKEPTNKERKQWSFREYLCDMVRLYHKKKSLAGMSELQKKHKVSAITKQQFFEFGLDEAANEQFCWLDPDWCNEVYDYILNREKKGLKVPKYVAG